MKPVTAQPEPVHEAVSQAYTEALRRTRQSKGSGGCCATGCCASVVETAGYEQELEAFAEAGASSFGCGNPLAFAEVQPGQTVLDLGSGAGFDLLIAAQKVGPEGKVIGVDMTDAMIEAARHNAERAGAPQIEVRKGLIEALPVADASVDHVISNCVINLSPDKHKVFAEIARVLKPGGMIRISDIVAESMPDAIRKHAAAYAACPTGALHAVARFGHVRMVTTKKCIGCRSCIKSCSYRPASALWNPFAKHAQKCDLCADAPYHWDKAGGGPQGKQACVEVCPVSAIKFTREIPEQKGDKGYKVNLRGAAWKNLKYPTTD